MGMVRSLSEPVSEGARVGQVHRLPPQKAEDAQLVAAALSGDDRAAEAIWDRFSPLVRSIARRSLGPSSDVSDLVQDAFLQLFRTLSELRDPLALRSFLIGITLRVIGTELRKRRVRRWLRLTDTGTVPEVAALADDPEAREALRRLYAALDRVSDEERLVFVLRHIQGLELTEVAAALDISLATTKRRLQKVMTRLVATAERDPALSSYLEPALGEGDAT